MNSINITIKKKLIAKELLHPNNQCEVVMFSGDNRILFCGGVIIQLSAGLNDVKDLGSLIMKQEHSNVTYRFLSLKKDDERK